MVALALAGCTGVVQDDPGVISLSLEALGRDAQVTEAEVAETLERCMATEGFDYWVGLSDEGGFDDATVVMAEAALPSEQELRDTGYGIVSGGLTDQPLFGWEKRNEQYRAELGAAEQRAYDTALSGCTLEATRINAELAAKYQNLSELGAEVDARVRADADVVAAIEDWARCMSREGWDFAAPGDPQRAIVSRFNELAKSEAGVQLAGGTPAGLPTHEAFDRTIAEASTLDMLARIETDVAVDDSICRRRGFTAAVTSATRRVEAELDDR